MFLAVVGFMTISAQYLAAQTPEETAAPAATETVDQSGTVQQEIPIHQQLKAKFIEGGAGFMASILIVLILGLARGDLDWRLNLK